MHIDAVAEIFHRNMTTLARESAARRRVPRETVLVDGQATVPATVLLAA